MNSILLGSTLVAVAWLSVWAVKDHSRPSKTWWLFAMREPDEPRSKARWGADRPGAQVPVESKPMQRPWRRSGS
jgi:hypothetical protein